MPELSVNRTLVKSPPELWSELSEVERLANHLGEFGEIRISRLDPEHTVAWEGEHACGTVEIEAAGWGTKVTLKAEVKETEPPEAAEVVAQAPPPPAAAPVPPPAPASPITPRVVRDLEAWSASAAAIERHAQLDTPAARRAAERMAERAQREKKRRLFWPFRGRRSEPETPEVEACSEAPSMEVAGPEPLWSAPEPPAPAPQPAFEPEPAPEPQAAPAPAEPPVDEERARAVLEAALDNLGSAHHRPFSRG